MPRCPMPNSPKPNRPMPNRPMLAATRTLIAAAALAALPFAARAADPATPPAAAPATQPVDPAVQALVKQLGSNDPAARDAAAQKLKDLGRAALPALREAAKSDDLEIQGRARSLVSSAEKRLPAPAPQDAGFGRQHSVSVSVTDGEKVTVVDSDGYRVRIREGAAGITMDVTGVENGKPSTETYAAKDAETLKKDSPEAFDLYEKYKGGGPGVAVQVGGNGGIAFGQAQVGGGIVVAPGGGGPIVIGPGGFGAGGVGGGVGFGEQARVDAQQRMIDSLIRMKAQMEAQLDQANVPPEQRMRAIEQIDQMIARHQQQIDAARLRMQPADADRGDAQRRADQARKEAELQRREADLQRREAELKRREALDEAGKAREEAKKALDEARKAKEDALKDLEKSKKE
ncbi:MAG TPA: hypothetical protein VF796_16050 [Humisphaera sp.]